MEPGHRVFTGARVDSFEVKKLAFALFNRRSRVS